MPDCIAADDTGHRALGGTFSRPLAPFLSEAWEAGRGGTPAV